MEKSFESSLLEHECTYISFDEHIACSSVMCVGPGAIKIPVGLDVLPVPSSSPPYTHTFIPVLASKACSQVEWFASVSVTDGPVNQSNMGCVGMIGGII